MSQTSAPAKMDAVVLRGHGGADALTFVSSASPDAIDVPEPGPGQVRVAVRAVSVNHLDIWVRRGGPAFRLAYPHRLGADVAGVIDALGAGVSDLTPGDRAVVHPGVSCAVCAACLAGADNLCRHYKILGENTQGGYAQYIVVPRQNVLPYPGELPFEHAAAVLLPYLTAWQMLAHKAALRPGQVVLIHGGGSGVGVAAIQIAKLFGARVITTASTDAKLDKARALGADETINYASEDFVARARAMTGKRGVDVVFEHVGGDTFTRSVKATASGGRIVTCGATSGAAPQLELAHVYFRQIQILGSTMGSKAHMLEVLDHVAAGRLVPVIHAVLPLAEAARAHGMLESREVFGKVILAP